MKKVIHRLFWAWQFEEEEQWLNDMSAQGWNLTRAGLFRYEFEKDGNGPYRYRLEYLKHFPNHPESREYIAFMEETGAEMVGSVKNWAYFRRSAAEGEFELFSDLDSRIGHLQRINSLMRTLAPVVLFVAAMNLIIGVIDGSIANVAVSIPNALLGWAIFRGSRSLSEKADRLSRERKIRE